jgi:hypothetical protein
VRHRARDPNGLVDRDLMLTVEALEQALPATCDIT